MFHGPPTARGLYGFFSKNALRCRKTDLKQFFCKCFTAYNIFE